MKKVYSVQLLRFLLAMFVVISHAGQQIIDVYYYPKARHFLPGPKLSLAELAVTSFIVVSGFVMYFSIQKPNVTTKKFLLNRFIRIYPLYFLFTLIYFIIYSWNNFFLKGPQLNIQNLFNSFFFVSKSPTLGMGWSLNLEVYFYIVCGIALLFGARKSVKILFVAMTALFAIEMWVYPFMISSHVYVKAAESSYRVILIYFLLGMIIAYLYERKLLFHQVIHLILIILGIYIGYITMNQYDIWPTLYIIPSFLIVYGTVGITIPEKYQKRCSDLGDLSYAIYLTHWIPIFIGIKFIMFTGYNKLPIDGYVWYIVIVVASHYLAKWIFNKIEMPSSDYLKMVFKKHLS